MPAATRTLWVELWKSPQAVAWENLRLARVVARYAQVLLICEAPGATAAMLAEARQIEDRLGLSPMAMRRLQWDISDDAREGSDAEVARLADYRDL